jgi:1-phosphatidylinositol-4-phosphate 5-kinase
MQGANLKVSDGKSGSFFCFSPDRKFIIKTVYPHEAAFLNTIITPLHRHFAAEKHTFIAKFYGFHGVQVHSETIHVVVMANVMDTNLAIHDMYDLKGSWINRTRRGRKAKIGLDLDFKRKIKLPEHLKPAYCDQIAKDAKFLSGLGIMDYSLLLGIHSFSADTEHKYHTEIGETDNTSQNRWRYGVMSSDETEMYFVGIIDILQFFNWSKKIEYFLKTRIMLRDSRGVSCVPPSLYSQRFVSAMGSHLEESV